MSSVRTKASKTTKSTKASDRIQREAIAVVDRNLARIEANEKDQAAHHNGHAKSGKKVKAPKPRKPKRVGGLDAAAKVLAEIKQPMNAKDLVKTMADKGYWNTPSGKTPHATIYAAMLREIATKGKESRFAKSDRGLFSLSA